MAEPNNDTTKDTDDFLVKTNIRWYSLDGLRMLSFEDLQLLLLKARVQLNNIHDDNSIYAATVLKDLEDDLLMSSERARLGIKRE